ncbi:MAG: methyltransferase domain-containing protein [Actinobacteria bacterium]|nr:methyltransferase domain-containing protein [Actinomycetota bacterium]
MTGSPDSPQTVKQQVSEGFAATAPGYDTTGTEFFSVMGDHLVAHARIPAGAWVLDVGCGKGAVSIPATRAAGPSGRVTGIDLAPVMLAHAEERARRAGVANVSFRVGDAEDPGTHPGWEPGSFDVVLAGNVVQFLPRPAHAVWRWRTLLTPPGRLGVSWSVAEDPRWVPVIAAFDTRMPEGITGFAGMLRRPPFASVDTFEAMLAGCGFHAPATVLHRVTMTYRTPEHWWEAARSQGPWAVAWRHLPSERLQAAQHDAFARLDALRAPDGTLTRTLTFACTVAYKNQP